jgi:Flp pilus assembly protein TadG
MNAGRWLRTIFDPLRNKTGAVVMLAALSLPVMLGFGALAIDVGVLYMNKVQLSAAADATVLAAAQELPGKPEQARLVALDYAVRNGKPADVATVTIAADNKSVEVEIRRAVPVYLANIFFPGTAQVAEKSKAQVSVAASVPWIVPFVIPKTQVFDHVNTFTMRIPDPYKPYGQYEFDYMNVGIENTNFATYIKYLKYGYQETFKVGDYVKYLGPSSGGRESVDAFYDRTLRDPNTDYSKAEGGQPRVMLIPVVNAMLPRNTVEGTPMKIIGFVGFFLETVYKGSYGKTYYARGKFLKDLNVGTGQTSSDAGIDFGVRTIQLVR